MKKCSLKDLEQFPEGVSIEFNPHFHSFETVSQYLTRHKLDGEMDAKTFMTLHKSQRLVRLTLSFGGIKQSVYGTTLDEVLTHVTIIPQYASIKKKHQK